MASLYPSNPMSFNFDSKTACDSVSVATPLPEPRRPLDLSPLCHLHRPLHYAVNLNFNLASTSSVSMPVCLSCSQHNYDFDRLRNTLLRPVGPRGATSILQDFPAPLDLNRTSRSNVKCTWGNDSPGCEHVTDTSLALPMTSLSQLTSTLLTYHSLLPTSLPTKHFSTSHSHGVTWRILDTPYRNSLGHRLPPPV